MLKEVTLDEVLGWVLINANKEFYTRCIINGYDVLEATLLHEGKLLAWSQQASNYDGWVSNRDDTIKALKSFQETPTDYLSSSTTEFKGFYVLCN